MVVEAVETAGGGARGQEMMGSCCKSCCVGLEGRAGEERGWRGICVCVRGGAEELGEGVCVCVCVCRRGGALKNRSSSWGSGLCHV